MSGSYFGAMDRDQLRRAFEAFTRPEVLRFDLGSPWTANGFTYATDSHVLLRVPATALTFPPDAEGQRRPACDGMLPAEGYCGWGPLPTLLPLDFDCPDCAGYGWYVECPCCEHPVGVPAATRNALACQACVHGLVATSPAQRDAGRIAQAPLHGRGFNAELLHRLANLLPDIEVGDRLLVIPDKKGDKLALPFTFAGRLGVGSLAPMDMRATAAGASP